MPSGGLPPRELGETLAARDVVPELVEARRSRGEEHGVAAEVDLRKKLADANVDIIGAVDSAMFNSPFMLPLFRRNEVHAPIDRIPVAAPAAGLVAEN